MRLPWFRKKRRYEQWDRWKVLEELKSWSEEHGRAPTYAEIPRSLANASKRYFGSWAKAKLEAGLTVYHKREPTEREKEAIREDYRSGVGFGELARKYHRDWRLIRGVIGPPTRGTSEAKLAKSGGYHRLSRASSSRSRAVKIPIAHLKALGFSEADGLEGRWEVKRNGLFLRVRRRR